MAGRQLADALVAYKGQEDALVLALPRGGVPVAHEVAQALSLPMDVWLVRKLGVPGQEELAMGAISLGGICHLEPAIISALGISRHRIEGVMMKEGQELERRNLLYRGDRPLPDVLGRTVLVVDDGLATGATMRAAVASLHAAQAGRVVVAVPVGAAPSCAELEDVADEVVCPHMPEPFYGVGRWYADFSQTSDREVQDILALYFPEAMPALRADGSTRKR